MENWIHEEKMIKKRSKRRYLEPLSEVAQVMELGSVYIVDPLFNSLILIVSIALIANVRTVLVVLIRFGVCHWGWRLRNRVTRKCAL